jgi:four helix bundle protein
MTTPPAREPAPHERLRVWQDSVLLVKVVYEETARWPTEERYGLVSQLRRAGVSIVANIAEGKARTGTRQYRLFVQIAYGSAREVEALLSLAGSLGIASDAQCARVDAKLVPVLKQLLRLIQALTT